MTAMNQVHDIQLSSGDYLTAPYFLFMQKVCAVLKNNANYALILEPEAVTKFKCSSCAECCQRPWAIEIPRDYYEKWNSIFDGHPSGNYQNPFLVHTHPTQQNHAEIRRKPGASECLFLQDDRSCFIHANYGEEALSQTCRKYPRYEGWFGSYLAKFLLNSCPDTGKLIQEYPRIQFSIVRGRPDIWQSLENKEHPMGLYPGFLWLGYQLDLIHNTSWTAIQKVRYLASKLKQIERLDLSKLNESTMASVYRDFLNDLTPGSSPPLSQKDEERGLNWLLHFTELFPSMNHYIESIKSGRKKTPALTKGEQNLLNQFLNHYLSYRFLTMNFRLTDGSIIFYQTYFLLALHLALFQFLVAFYRDKDGATLNQEHLLRAANLVGYRFEHAPKFVEKHKINQLSPKDSLEGMEILLHFDFGYPLK